MNKAHRKGACAYCGSDSNLTADHVIARSFFIEEHRGNLPIVSSCNTCNNEKSKLEHILVTILQFGSKAQPSAQIIQSTYRRLEKNRALDRKLTSSLAIEQVAGALQITVDGDQGALESLCEYIVKGLTLHLWNKNIGEKWKVRASFLTKDSSDFYDQYFVNFKDRVVLNNYGDGIFKYEVIRDDPRLNIDIWKISWMKGAEYTGDPEMPNFKTSNLYVFSGPEDSAALARIVKDLDG